MNKRRSRSLRTPDRPRTPFQKRLCAVMDKNDWSWYSLWKNTMISPSMLQNLRKGGSNPSIETAVKIARATGVSLDYLCDVKGELANEETH